MADNNPNNKRDDEQLHYIEESLRLLQQARDRVKSASATVFTESANSSTSANEDFRTAFPGLSSSYSSGRHLQTHLPSIRPSRTAASSSARRFQPYSNTTNRYRVQNTWTHDFICLADCEATATVPPRELDTLRSAGLGKKRIVFRNKRNKTLKSYFPRLKSQEGAFQISKAAVGGHGIRELQPIRCTGSGYSVQMLKEEARSSVCYIIPLNSNLDLLPLQVYDLTLSEPHATCKCARCGCMINFSEFKEHRDNCYSEEDTKQPTTSENSSAVSSLQLMFPDHKEEDLEEVLSLSSCVSDAVEHILNNNAAVTEDNDKIIDDVDLSRSAFAKNLDYSSGTLSENLNLWQKNTIKEDDSYTLNVDRGEIWRNGLAFYKKANVKPHILHKSFEVQFSVNTGESESVDAGAIRTEFFEKLMEEFNNRIMEGGTILRVPCKGESINHLLFGTFLGHSLLHGGPGFYCFQPWVYQVICGNEDPDQLMTMISQNDIPLHAGSKDAVNLISSVDLVTTQEELNDLVDHYMQVINCLQWDPTTPITLSNKSLLASEIIYDELVRKRMGQIRSIREGLRKIGFDELLNANPTLSREIFTTVNSCDVTYLEIMKVMEDINTAELQFEKEQAYKFFDNFLKSSPSEVLQKILKFITGFTKLPPWGLKRKISTKFLADDDEKIYPTAMACFYIIYLPTVHSQQSKFTEHMLKALDLEGEGFSAMY